MIFLLTLPLRLVGAGYRTGVLSARITRRTVRFVGYRRLALLLVGVGIGLLVAASTNIPGPDNATYLTELSQRSNVHLVAAAAYYLRQNYPAGTDTIAEDELAELLVRGAASAKLGAFGELGVTNNTADLDPVERKVFRAFGRAQARTNIPIFTHNNYATGANVPMDMALRQLDALEAGGANPKALALGHVCCLFDPMVDVAKRVAREIAPRATA